MSRQSHKVGGWVFPTLLPPPSPPTMLEFWKVQRREVLTPLHPSLLYWTCTSFLRLPQQITTKGLEQQKRILSKFWRPEARNQGAAGPCLLQRVQGNILSHLFQLLWVTPGIPWPLHSHGFPFGVSVFSSASKLPLPFSYKDACHWI